MTGRRASRSGRTTAGRALARTLRGPVALVALWIVGYGLFAATLSAQASVESLVLVGTRTSGCSSSVTTRISEPLLVHGVWKIPGISVDDMGAGCNGHTLHVTLLDAAGVTVAESASRVTGTSARLHFAHDVPADDVMRVDVVID